MLRSDRRTQEEYLNNITHVLAFTTLLQRHYSSSSPQATFDITKAALEAVGVDEAAAETEAAQAKLDAVASRVRLGLET